MNCRASRSLSAWFNLQPWVLMATVGRRSVSRAGASLAVKSGPSVSGAVLTSVIRWHHIPESFDGGSHVVQYREQPVDAGAGLPD